MNNSASKSLHVNNCEFPARPCKKQRRHRNRYKNYNLKKKKLKKFPSISKTGFVKSGAFNFKPDSEKIMSNWYWSNYKKALEWQERHKVTYWKSYALALFEENRYLLEIINHMRPGMVSGSSLSPQAVGRGINFNNKPMRMKYSEGFPGSAQNNIDEDSSYSSKDENNAEDEDDKVEEVEDDFEFEVSEEMIQFFQQSYKRKMDIKKLKEKESTNNIEKQVQQVQSNRIKRSVEMNFLYGDGTSMITGMETAVQLSFNKYCDIYSPKYWPNIPFKL